MHVQCWTSLFCQQHPGIDGTILGASIGRIRILNNLCMEMHSLALIILTTNCPVVCAVRKQHCGDREKNLLDNQFFSTQSPFRVQHFHEYIYIRVADIGHFTYFVPNDF